ncbi:MAG: hypothetical protein PUC65_08335 [Clostridiales bacterium]|nr:hypothetical protein [Clostridiales bacterium]
MCYVVIPTPRFESDVDFYERKRKYRNITEDIKSIVEDLEKGNLIGNPIPELTIEDDNHTYKVRVANSDANQGKSNGYRLIYYAVKDDREIFLLTIYSKKDDNRIPSNEEIAEIVKEYCTEAPEK